jgi:hypothetical protein
MKTAPIKTGRKLFDFSQYDFGGGINIQDSPQKLADNDLSQAVNVYLSTEGDVLSRRGVNLTGASFPANTPMGSRGIYRFYQEIASGAISTFRQTIQQVGSTLYDQTTGNVIGTVGQLGTGALPMSCERIFDPSHNGGTDILVICVGSSGGPFAYDGTTLYNLDATPTTVTGARWCKLLNNILWFAGLPGQPNLVAASGIGQPESTPAYNTFALSTPVTGLGTLGIGLQAVLVVGLVSGIALLSGFTPVSFIEQDIPMNDGVIGGRAMITIDGILYFIGNFAIYKYDGSSFQEISRKVRPWILNDPTEIDYPMNGDRMQSWAMYWNRRIYFWYISNPTNSGNTKLNTALVWDLDRQGWTIYSSAIGFGAGCLINAPGDPTPEVFVMVDQTTGNTYNFDVYLVGQSSFNATDNGQSIASTWLSKFFKIGDPGSEKRVLRILMEVFFYQFNGAVQIVTDYGQTTLVQEIPLAYNANAEWDSSSWDQFDWASIGAGYSKTRIDVNIQAEAFAFGIVCPNPNPPPTPIQTQTGMDILTEQGAEIDTETPSPGNLPYGTYRCMGFTGRYSQMPKN